MISSNKKETPNKRSFPAISITLEEIRRLFDLEEGRRQSLENKAGILMGIIGVILTIAIFEATRIIEIIPFYILLVMALLFTFLVVKPRRYKIPHKEYNNFYKYAKMDEERVMDKFLLNYIEVTKNTEGINDSKEVYLERSFIITSIAIVYLIGLVTYVSF